MQFLKDIWDGAVRIWKTVVAWRTPIGAIPKQFGSFLIWVVTALGVGGLSVWFMPFFRPDLKPSAAYVVALTSGALGTFCLALLGEALSTNVIQAYRRRPWEEVEGGRGVASVLSVAALIAQTVVIGNLSRPEYAANYVGAQVVIAVVVLALATYLHCFHLEEEAAQITSWKTEDDNNRRRLEAQSRATMTTKEEEKI